MFVTLRKYLQIINDLFITLNKSYGRKFMGNIVPSIKRRTYNTPKEKGRIDRVPERRRLLVHR